MTPMALDITIAVVILCSMVIAYLRGIVKEVFTIVAIVAAVGTTYFAGHLLIPEFNDWLGVPKEGEEAAEEAALVLGILSPELAAKAFSYGSAFLFTFIVMTLIGYFISRTIKEMGLGLLDRVLGAGFGFLRGFIVVFLLFLPINFLVSEEKFPDWAKESYSVPILKAAVDFADQTFELKKKIEDRGDGIAIKIEKIDTEKLGKAALKKIEELPPEKKEQLEQAVKNYITEEALMNPEEHPLPPPSMNEEAP